jgi:hypothetical protein
MITQSKFRMQKVVRIPTGEPIITKGGGGWAMYPKGSNHYPKAPEYLGYYGTVSISATGKTFSYRNILFYTQTNVWF